MGDDDLIVVITSYGIPTKFNDDNVYHNNNYEALLVPRIDVYELKNEKIE